VIAMAEVRLTMEEYNALVRAAEVPASVQASRDKTSRMQEAINKKRAGKKDPKMSRALKKANDWGRTKSGKLRKGVSQGDIMSKAHALRRKM